LDWKGIEIMKALVLLVVGVLSVNSAFGAESCFDRIRNKKFKCRLKFSDGVPREPIVLEVQIPSSRTSAQFDFTTPDSDFPYSCSCGYTGTFDDPQFKQSTDTFFCGSLGGGFSGFISPNNRNITLEISGASGIYGVASCKKKR